MNRHKTSPIIDRPSPADLEGLFDLYLAHGCPCRFPRFRAAVGRNLQEEIGDRDWNVSDAGWLLTVFDRRVPLIEDSTEDFARRGRCKICGAEVVRSWAPVFRDSFLERAHITPGALPDVGAVVSSILPICGRVFRAAPGNVTRDEQERVQGAFPRLKPREWIAYMSELET
jgi:hypothetical protein